MTRLAIIALVVASAAMTSAPAHAQKKKPSAGPLSLPAVGETLAPNGAASWPQKLDWLYDVPSFKDATGKIVLHWFCSPKVDACAEDLERIVKLKENNARVYVVAYIAGAKGEAKALDPIRETEGVGRGTVAYGKNTTALLSRLGTTGPASVVVGIDGKVAHVTRGGAQSDADARDAKVAALANAIRDFTVTSDGPTIVKPGDKFRLAMTVKLASWLKYNRSRPADFQLTAPADIKCDNTALRGGQLTITDQTMVAQVTCSGTKGVYELRGAINFSYDNPVGGGTGLGSEGAVWKFEIKPMGIQ
ncbi:MAG TPA: hypothetical protein VNO30_00225 [Kofleriaceae bacterium]|nr:hypothetical protein [Kofleriaceae bacterium]